MSGTERMDYPNAPKHQPMPGCMMPDGAEPCAGFRYEAEARNNERASNDKLRDEIERLRAMLRTLSECDPYEPVGAWFPEIRDALGVAEQEASKND